MQLSATVEGVDITDRRPTRTVRAVDLRSNDREYSLEADPRESLPDVLRERLHLTSTKKGARGVEGLRELRRVSRRPIANTVHHATGRRRRDVPTRSEIFIRARSRSKETASI